MGEVFNPILESNKFGIRIEPDDGFIGTSFHLEIGKTQLDLFPVSSHLDDDGNQVIIEKDGLWCEIDNTDSTIVEKDAISIQGQGITIIVQNNGEFICYRDPVSPNDLSRSEVNDITMTGHPNQILFETGKGGLWVTLNHIQKCVVSQGIFFAENGKAHLFVDLNTGEFECSTNAFTTLSR